MSEAVRNELQAGRSKGYDVPNPDNYSWLKVINPKSTPSEWLTLDLGVDEIAAMALALENPDRVVLLDDMLARQTAQAAGLQVWGTLIDDGWRIPAALWARIAPLLPPQRTYSTGGRPRMPDRQAMEAIVSILRTGCQWNALPRSLGAASTVHDRFQA